MKTMWLLYIMMFTTTAASAADPYEAIRRGNAHFQAGAYEAALSAYDEVTKAPPGGEYQLLHNRAAAHYKLGAYDDARELWTRIKNHADADLAAQARYNLGNCSYQEALAAVQQDPQAALDKLTEAREQYQGALRINPSLADARANLELSQQLAKQIEELLQQSPQSQPSQQQQDQDNQQQCDSQPSNSQQQQQEQQQNQQQQDQQQQGEDTQSGSQQQPGQQDEQSGQDQPPEEQAQQQDQAAPGEDEQQPQQPQDAAEQQEPQEGDQPPVPIEMTRAQAERLLQKIRDAEKRRREQLARQRARQQKPVERDW